MKVDIICVGKIKENYWVDAIKEYTKRLSKYIKINIYEVKDEQTPDKAGEKEELMIKQAEAQRMQKYINNDAILVALAIEGKEMSSEDFSDFFADNEVHSNSHIQFIIGGSLGIDDDLKKKSSKKISFSKMTFPHQMMRVILLEQIYRAYKIKCGEPYHK